MISSLNLFSFGRYTRPCHVITLLLLSTVQSFSFCFIVSLTFSSMFFDFFIHSINSSPFVPLSVTIAPFIARMSSDFNNTIPSLSFSPFLWSFRLESKSTFSICFPGLCRRVKECVPAFVMISKGLRYFSENFFVGRVEQKNFARTKACCPTWKSGAGDRCLSAGPW